MRVILLREGGFNLSLDVTRGRLLAGGVLASVMLGCLLAFAATTLQPKPVDEAIVAQWRAKLSEQNKLVAELARRSESQSSAVGRQLAEMQARLMRMEAIGAHMADAADLEGGEFDFDTPPAQGGPVLGQQTHMEWAKIQQELSGFAAQLRRREVELNILDSVLVSEDIQATSQVRGRPVKWGWLSSKFGERVDPITGQTAWHSGVDFAGHDGSDVVAVASGVVTYAGERYGYGKLVEISHANGMVTRYAHHKELKVKAGEVVKKGDTIGLMGSSGRSTGPHVHFEVLKNGRTVNPANYVRS